MAPPINVGEYGVHSFHLLTHSRLKLFRYVLRYRFQQYLLSTTNIVEICTCSQARLFWDNYHRAITELFSYHIIFSSFNTCLYATGFNSILEYPQCIFCERLIYSRSVWGWRGGWNRLMFVAVGIDAISELQKVVTQVVCCRRGRCLWADTDKSSGLQKRPREIFSLAEED